MDTRIYLFSETRGQKLMIQKRVLWGKRATRGRTWEVGDRRPPIEWPGGLPPPTLCLGGRPSPALCPAAVRRREVCRAAFFHSSFWTRSLGRPVLSPWFLTSFGPLGFGLNYGPTCVLNKKTSLKIRLTQIIKQFIQRVIYTNAPQCCAIVAVCTLMFKNYHFCPLKY